jgi:flagellar biosynthesis protein FlhF
VKLKRFVAPTMREALDQVRAEQGPEAVIITNRRIEEGIEIISAVDYDPERLAEALADAEPLVARPAPPAMEPAAAEPPVIRPEADGFRSVLARMQRDAGAPAAPAARPPTAAAADARPTAGRAQPAGAGRTVRPAAATAAPGPGPKVVWSQDAAIVGMRREIEALRRMLEFQLSRLAWDDLARREPFRAKVLRDLSSLDLAPDLARRLVNEMPALTRPEDASRVALALLVRHIPVVDDGLVERGGVFALVGPTGAGKTTTIAKLAARHALVRGPGSVGLISTDSYRIGAREQLLTYARLLGVPMHVASNAGELAAALEDLSDRSLVLIDTAGIAQRDLRLAEQAALLASQGDRIRRLLALPANADIAALDDIVRAHARLGPEACVVTKIDEAATLGPVLSATIRAGLPIAHLCDGQRVPEDLHEASPKRIWLVRRAVKLRQLTGRRADEQYLADQFGKAAHV